MTENTNLRQHAANAISGFNRLFTAGKTCDVNRASVYGIALKYFITQKSMSVAQASKMLGYKSPQCFNFVLNRRKEKDFFRDELTFFCARLGINEEMFFNLCKEIKFLLKTNGQTN